MSVFGFQLDFVFIVGEARTKDAIETLVGEGVTRRIGERWMRSLEALRKERTCVGSTLRDIRNGGEARPDNVVTVDKGGKSENGCNAATSGKQRCHCIGSTPGSHLTYVLWVLSRCSSSLEVGHN